MDAWQQREMRGAGGSQRTSDEDDWSSTLAARFLATRDGQPRTDRRPDWDQPTAEYGTRCATELTPAQYMRSIAAEQSGVGPRFHNTWRYG